MALIQLNNVSMAYGAERLLDGISLNIEEGDRISLVGRNGAGKSTLLKLLNGDLLPDEGEIVNHAGARVAYLPQAVRQDLAGSVAEVVAAGAIEAGHATHHDDPKHQQTVARVISHLGLDPSAESAHLSGGQKRRVLLARALACEPDILLLDEPTNHLDIDSICWMENFLLRHCRTLLFVTHDRAFLRRVANRIVDLDRGRLAQWSCDYDTFLQRKNDLLHDETVYRASFDKKLAKEEAWIRQGIKARRTRDEGRVRALMAMREERRARRLAQGQARLQVQAADLSGRKVIDVKDISFAYPGEPPIVAHFSTRIMRGDKIGVIGPNGSGKTTLLKLLTGRLQPDAGEVVAGTRVQTAYFDQHRAQLHEHESVAQNAGQGLDTITIDGHARHILSYLRDFLFTPDRANQPVSVLSGGERNRLLLAMLFARPSNLLVMDEPTNDLDVETLELLEEQLANYPGTVLMVSHDRAFLDNVVTGLFAMQGGGRVGEFVGGYDDWLKEQRAAGSTVAAGACQASPRQETRNRPFGYKQQRELKALPGQIEKLETRQEALHAKMAAPDYYRTPPEAIAADRQAQERLGQELESAFARWEELEALRTAQGG